MIIIAVWQTRAARSVRPTWSVLDDLAHDACANYIEARDSPTAAAGWLGALQPDQRTVKALRLHKRSYPRLFKLRYISADRLESRAVVAATPLLAKPQLSFKCENLQSCCTARLLTEQTNLPTPRHQLVVLNRSGCSQTHWQAQRFSVGLSVENSKLEARRTSPREFGTSSKTLQLDQQCVQQKLASNMQHSRSILAGLCSLLLLRPAESARSLRSSSSSSSAVSSGWVTGIATNYGGPSEGKDPYSPSFGTSDVSNKADYTDCTFLLRNTFSQQCTVCTWFALQYICSLCL